MAPSVNSRLRITPEICGRTSAVRSALTRPGSSVSIGTEVAWMNRKPTSGAGVSRLSCPPLPQAQTSKDRRIAAILWIDAELRRGRPEKICMFDQIRIGLRRVKYQFVASRVSPAFLPTPLGIRSAGLRVAGIIPVVANQERCHLCKIYVLHQ